MYNNKGIEIYKINSNTLNFFNKYSLLKKRKTPPINKTLKIKVPILRQIPKKNNNINKLKKEKEKEDKINNIVSKEEQEVQANFEDSEEDN